VGPVLFRWQLQSTTSATSNTARLGQSPVEPEHVLVAMLAGDGIAARVLRELGATEDGVRKRIAELRAG
jgi:hypothetical protein